MKKIILLSFIFLLSVNINAQQEINTNFATQKNHLFGSLDKNKIPHGILLDYGMKFTNISAYNGILTNNVYSNISRLEDIYKTLVSSRIKNVTTGFVSSAIYTKNIKDSRTKGVVVLGGLFYKYATFNEDALLHQKIRYSHGKLYDKYTNGVWQNPYLEKQTFAMAPFIQKYSGLDLQVRIPINIFYSNYQSQIQSLQVDFGNGSGYITVPFNQNITISYTAEGIKTWKYKLNLSNGTAMYNQSKIKIDKGFKTVAYGTQNYQRSAQNSVNRYLHKKITATRQHLGEYGSVNLTIDLAPNHSAITKPLIVAEGFDVGVVISPENEYGYSSYREFKKTINDGGLELYRLLKGSNRQYDIIYVDWDNGVDYMQRNAYALEEVIKWVNQQKSNTGSTEKNVVLGQSMGGVISRYALADMEERGENHDIRLFISHDAPQQGANIPISVQYMYRHANNQYISSPFSGTIDPILSLFNQPTVSDYLSMADTPATKQLLKNRINTNYQLDNNEHSSFYNELRNKGVTGSGGYPINCRNIAISNGSECGNKQNFSPGDDLVDIDIESDVSWLGNLLIPFVTSDNAFGAVFGSFLNVFSTDTYFSFIFNAKSLTYNAGSKIYNGRISYTEKILWIISHTTTITDIEKFQPSGVLPFDSYGGGYFNTREFSANAPNGTYIRDKFSFIPTASALDIGNNNITLNDADYKRSYVGGNPPTGSKNSPFANFSTDFDRNPNVANKQHISFNPRNGNWLVKELNQVGAITDCAAFCGSTKITGEDILCSTGNYTIGTSSTVIWSVSEGNNLVSLNTVNNHTTNISQVSTNNSGYVTLKGYINSECGSITLTKRFFVGVPNDYFNGNITPHPYPGNGGGFYLNNWTRIWMPEYPSGNNWNWTANYSMLRNVNSAQVLIKPLSLGYMTIKVRKKNKCGYGNWLSKNFYITQQPGGGGHHFEEY